ncbi:MAG: hypothetical protein K0S32_1562 [Bacteroidetes bacterium]|jgi:hypothetical protein|nr:hypothetical protein [Bacteroidota bacterium]
MKRFLLLFACAFLSVNFFAQNTKTSIANPDDWVILKNKPGANFYDIQKAFNDYWQDKDITVKGIGYKPFKRWEYMVEPRVYPSGDLSVLGQNDANFKAFLAANPPVNSANKVITSSSSQIASTTWTAIGPMGAMTGSATNGLPRKAGRDNFITFHPTTANTFWVGSPAGGLWKTTDNGTSWTTNTDNLTVIGCSDLAIDPTNTTIMYLATGDGDAGDTRSTGVLKSTDGGNSWNVTGLTNAVSNYFLIRRLIINPSNTQVLIAATNAGIYRTANAGTSWSQITTFDAFDLEFKPGDPNTVYATSNNSFYRSVNGGTSFTQISNGIPTTGANRLAVAVTTADPAYVYVLRSNTSSGFGGLYRSVTSGTAFTVMSTTPDVLANSCAGSSGSGQGWYDLAIASSPLNKDEVVVGGVNHWRSLNGGATWANIGCWNSTAANPPYVHADVHELEYTSTGTLYSANDGGIYYYNGTSWPDITATRNIAQIYRIGTSSLLPNRWITGHQDNGSNIYNGTTYAASYPGDGMDCFIDRTNDANMFASTPNGGYVRSTNSGASWSGATSGLTGGTYWVSPWKQDPVTANTLYCSRLTLWRSTNLGATWTTLAAIPGTAGQGVIEFAIAPSNNQVIYVIHGNSGVYKTTNAGTSWAAFNTGLPIASAQAEFIAIDPTDANNAWVVFSGYSSGNKVFMTTNGGTSWTNVSSNLPNLPTNCIVYEPGSADRVYVGMDVGVYYKDNSGPNWTLYNNGLPNTPVHDMEISPANPTKLRAATYGRGVYEVDVVPPALPPSSAFNFSGTFCTGTPKTFNDVSTNSPSSWSWSVTPSAGVSISTPTAQNPSFTFANSGTYTVTLIATNGAGPGAPSNQTVSINATPTVALTNSVQTICSGSSATITASGAATYSWNTGATTASIGVSPASTTIYTVTGTSSGCTNVRTATVNVNTTPTVVITNSVQTICAGATATINASGATTYSWNTGATSSGISVSPGVMTVYTVTGTSSGCMNVKTATVNITANPTVVVTNSVQTICSGATATITAGGATTYSWNTGATAANVTVSPAGTTVYTVTGTTSGCTNVKTATINVNASPTVNVNSPTICNGGSATITAAGASTYSWNTGATSAAVVVSPGSTTVYTVTGTTGGCTNIKTATVSVNTTPTVAVTGTLQTICAGTSATISAGGAATYSWNTGATSANISVSPLATTVYTVTGYNGSCSSAIKMATITVNSSPIVTVNNATICSGASTNLNATGASTYSWNTGATSAGISVSPASTTVYTVTGTSGGCNNVKTATVNVNLLPSINISANNTFVCQGQMVSLSAMGANTFTWQPGNVTGTVANFIPSASQVYTCTGTDLNGCVGNNSVSITVSSCTGIMNGDNEIAFNIYPNPAKDQLTININTTKQFECNIELTDASGKIVYKQKAKFVNNSNEHKIGLSTFASGIYFMKIVTKEGNGRTIKVVKE